MGIRELNEASLEQFAPPEMLKAARLLLDTQNFTRIQAGPNISIRGNCGERPMGLTYQHPDKLLNECTCRGPETIEQPCVHSLAVVLKFYQRSEELGEELTEERNDLTYRLLLPEDFDALWKPGGSIDTKWEQARIRGLSSLHEVDKDSHVNRLANPSPIATGIACEKLSLLFQQYQNSDLLYLQTEDGELVRIDSPADPHRLRAHLKQEDSVTVSLTIEIEFDDGYLLVTPVPDHELPQRELLGYPYGWVFRCEANELHRLAEPQNLNLARDYDEMLEAARTRQAVERPPSWIAHYRKELEHLFNFDPESQALLYQLGDGDDFQPAIAMGSPAPVLNRFLFTPKPRPFYGQTSSGTMAALLEPLGFQLRDSVIQLGDHPDIYRGLTITVSQDDEWCLQIWISTASTRGSGNLTTRPLIAGELPHQRWHLASTEEQRAQLLSHIADNLQDRLEQLERDRGLELLMQARESIEIVNRCLERLRTLLRVHSSIDVLLEEITPQAREISDSVMFSTNVDSSFRTLSDLAATLLSQELPTEELIRSNGQPHALTKEALPLLIDRITNTSGDRVVSFLEETYRRSLAERKRRQPRRDSPSITWEKITFLENFEEQIPMAGSLSEHELKDHIPPNPTPLLRTLCQRGLEAIWVQGRLLSLFGGRYLDEQERDSEHTIVDSDLIATFESGERILFNVCDSIGRSCLIFAPDQDRSFCEAAARAFWSLLLSEQKKLKDFEGDVDEHYHFALIDGAAYYAEGVEPELEKIG